MSRGKERPKQKLIGMSDVRPKAGNDDLGAFVASIVLAEDPKHFSQKAPESQLEPSGKAKIHVVKHSTMKEAQDAARGDVSRFCFVRSYPFRL